MQSVQLGMTAYNWSIKEHLIHILNETYSAGSDSAVILQENKTEQAFFGTETEGLSAGLQVEHWWKVYDLTGLWFR